MTDFNAPETRTVAHGRRVEEVWESDVEGRVWVEATDHRGAPRMLTTLGVGQRLRITPDDRLLAQERVRQRQNDPFVNGMLRRVDADQSNDPTTETPDAMSDEDLKLVFSLDEADFIEEVNRLSEVPLRRMKHMAPANASIVQDKILTELIAERYPIGGDTPTYREMNPTT